MIRLLERILIGILVLIGLITLYLHFQEGLTFKEAVISSLMLFSAGEPLDLHPGKMSWFTGILVVTQTIMGLATLTIVMALITNFLFSERIQKMFEKPKITEENHVILCGLGNVGSKVLQELLRLNQKVVVIDWGDDKHLVDMAKKKAVPVLKENLKDETSLELANIDKAKSLIICTGNDMVNMEVALNARERRPDIPIVMRMFDQKLAKKLSHAFNIRIAFSSSQLAAPVFAAASIDRSIFGSLHVENEIFISARKEIQPGTRLDGMTVDQLLKEREVTILKLISGEERIKIPKGNRVLKAGDILYIACTHDELMKVKAMNRPPE
ncbi:MAG: hypothetical protein D6785_13590 [Planctomycetota bacterium]|nr:MAG: hypothetical protein D6785_13590 [Planctomycetota bacterium]